MSTLENKEEKLKQANIRLAILYTLPDICESLLLSVLEYREKAGLKGLKFEQKKYWNAFKKDCYNLRSVMHSTDINTQSSYADTCELLERLILTAIDRCADKDIPLMYRFLEYIESFPSKRGMEIF